MAIVGGGVAGCYVAYRLLQATAADFDKTSPLLPILKKKKKGKLDVALFEYSGRVGGRLLSAVPPEVLASGDSGPDLLVDAEFGGFRFQPQMHIVADLATALFGTSPHRHRRGMASAIDGSLCQLTISSKEGVLRWKMTPCCYRNSRFPQQGRRTPTDRYIGLDAHASSCTLGVLGPGGKRLGLQRSASPKRRRLK